MLKELFGLNINTWNYLNAIKQTNSGLFKNNVTYKLFIYKSYIFNIYIYIYIKDLVLNNLQSLIWRKTNQPTNQTTN